MLGDWSTMSAGDWLMMSVSDRRLAWGEVGPDEYAERRSALEGR